MMAASCLSEPCTVRSYCFGYNEMEKGFAHRPPPGDFITKGNGINKPLQGEQKTLRIK